MGDDSKISGEEQFDNRLSSEAANALLRENADAILIGDVERHVLVWGNPAGLRMLGRPIEEVKGLPLEDMHPPKDLPYVLDKFDRQAKGEFTLARDIPVLSADGTVSYHDVQSVLVKIGSKTYLMGCFRDISERRAAERVAVENEDRFRTAIQSCPMGLFIYALKEDGSLVMEGVNEACSKILGVDVTAMVGMRLEDAFPPLADTEIPDAYRRVAREGGVWQNVSVQYKDEHIDGAFEVLAFQVKPGETGVLFWDVTEKQKAEDQMRRLMAAINAMAESVIITNSDGIIQYANPFFEELTGFTLGDLIGQHVRMLKSGAQDDAFYKRLWDVLGNGRTWAGTFINKKKDGSLYHESATISPVRNADGEVVSYVAVKRDMTRELDLERRVMRSQKMAALGQFAHRVAHDVTNSLSTILGSAEILGHMNDGDGAKEMVNAIIGAVDNVSGLTTSLMGFAHPGALNTRKTRLDTLISGIESMIGRACKPNVDVTYELEETVRAEIDGGQIEQAIMHLVVNATEAIEHHGSLRISLEKGLMPAQIASDYESTEGEVDAAIITLTDSGVGLTKEECEHAFEPFFSTKRDARRNAGLGLATVYSIIARHNGDITITSKKGEGAAIRIALPLVE